MSVTVSARRGLDPRQTWPRATFHHLDHGGGRFLSQHINVTFTGSFLAPRHRAGGMVLPSPAALGASARMGQTRGCSAY